MSIEIIPINGKSQYFDYENFEKSIEETIGKRCSDAKVFLFNNFPVSVSFETNIDLIIVIAIEDKKGNFYIPKSNSDGKAVYFHNQIIPLKFITRYQDDTITIDDEQIIANEEYIDYSTEINSIRFGLINYLSYKCGMNRQELFVQPLIFVKNKNEFIQNNLIIAETFDFKTIHKYFAQNGVEIFIANKNWRSEIGYQFTLNNDIERITEQASKDSEIGYLTKKKVDRIGKKLSNSRLIYEELNKHLVIVSGKAGTGKSSELLLLTIKCISNGQNTLYLTYNKLLILDIAKTVKSYVNVKLANSNNKGEKPGEASVLTLHAFFYRLSKSLGVLHVLSEVRIENLLDILKDRIRKTYDIVKSEIAKNTNIDGIKKIIQNSSKLDIGTKEVGIDFLNFLKSKNGATVKDLNRVSINFYNHKKSIIGNIGANEVFLADYYGVLENTLLQIQNPEQFYDKYNIENKHELLDVAIGLNKKYIGEKDGRKTITEEGFVEFKNRRIGGHRRKRTLFIDEAQDCHRLEKEILISIYGSNNVVVANGGKEQLIRHVELCNWEVSQTKKLEVKKHFTKNKSYRVKKTVVDFCNYVAKRFQIDLNLEPLESEDEGELLFDFRLNLNETEVTEVFKHLKLKGEINGCLPYENLLVLLESNSQKENIIGVNETKRETAIINEYDNIEDTTSLKRGNWKHLEVLENNDFMFWDGTTDDKSQLIVPSPNESRVIYYESCRGLEAWTVACFALDKFFSQKRKDHDAEKYLIEDLFLNQDNEQRKSMYAATWALMALTRVIDTLYVQINDRNSEFGKIVVDYINQNKENKNVREVGKNASH
ncbi:AAA family ATPase [Flavobacterium sp. HSC-61S13]|uniref:AAA family ATPase n=1 Tax=Flavobacterium sp. HSC-61S13 TaxID=2910963 RepID=UPI0020A0A9B5|nr:AAA family ATPase [Flavobacterium sp. HSC-61S13]MCP1997384.1 hypothetical protein [Flavobacterium sp. HSC-61S13]